MMPKLDESLVRQQKSRQVLDCVWEHLLRQKPYVSLEGVPLRPWRRHER